MLSIGNTSLLSIASAIIRRVLVTSFSSMKVVPIPALSDNYMYLLIDESSKQASIIDPVNVDSIKSEVNKAGVELVSSLVTHHHWDHASATEALHDACNKLPIYGGDKRISMCTNHIKDGDIFQVGELNVRCIATPCHTKGSICYYVTDSKENKAVFTGDTLFIGGCGRFFEGDANDMLAALGKLSKLPDDTHVYCGHEYTVQNLLFAKSMEPNNVQVATKLAWANERRGMGRFTVPSTIAEEKTFNPFMRTGCSEEMAKLAGSNDPVVVMACIREKKNNF